MDYSYIFKGWTPDEDNALGDQGYALGDLHVYRENDGDWCVREYLLGVGEDDSDLLYAVEAALDALEDQAETIREAIKNLTAVRAHLTQETEDDD